MIGLIVAVVVLFGGSIMASIAIPVFLNQRAKAQWQDTTVVIPASFNGEQRDTGETADRFAELLSNEAAAASLAEQSRGLVLVEQPNPGKLGGWIGCGRNEQGISICLGTDVGSLVMTISGADAGEPGILIRQARAAAVSRGGIRTSS